ncbi:ABC transporter substrate-binding protein [Pseudodesulfovibrio sp. S3-i]|nr:ABC transporter substrate-binding protein [Pseudodesulfovibrio sp. S3-i]
MSVNTLKLMWQEMGVPEQPIKVMPWARAYSKVQTEPEAVLFSVLRTTERESDFKWVGPIAKGRISLFSLKQNDIRIAEYNDLSKYRIGTIRNFPATSLLDKHGFDTVINAHIESGVKMLDSGRIDVLAMDDYAFFSTAKKMGYPADRFKRIWILSKGDLYIIFNPKTPDTLIARFQNALDSVKQKPAYRNMVNHYLD